MLAADRATHHHSQRPGRRQRTPGGRTIVEGRYVGLNQEDDGIDTIYFSASVHDARRRRTLHRASRAVLNPAVFLPGGGMADLSPDRDLRVVDAAGTRVIAPASARPSRLVGLGGLIYWTAGDPPQPHSLQVAPDAT